MPLYDYGFLKPDGSPSGECVEVFQSMRDEPLRELGGRPVRKLVTGARVQRTWHGAESVSQELVFDGSAETAARVKAECPSMELVKDPRSGWHKPVFRNDAHQRRVLKEMGTVLEQEDQRQAAARESRAMALVDAADGGALEESDE